MGISKKIIDACKRKLLEIKQKHAQTLDSMSQELVREVSSDLTDQAADLQEETRSLARRQKIVQEVKMINDALRRIDDGDQFGVCEITGEPIEEKRLLAVPWTKLSLEGAEIKETQALNADESEIADEIDASNQADEG